MIMSGPVDSIDNHEDYGKGLALQLMRRWDENHPGNERDLP